MMKRLINILLALALTTGLTAQTAREEIAANKYLAGSNYLDYDNYPAVRGGSSAPTAIPASRDPCNRPGRRVN